MRIIPLTSQCRTLKLTSKKVSIRGGHIAVTADCGCLCRASFSLQNHIQNVMQTTKVTDSSLAQCYRKVKCHSSADQQCSLLSQPCCMGHKSQIHEGEPSTAVCLLLPLFMPCCPACTRWNCRATCRLKLLLPRWLSQLYHSLLWPEQQAWRPSPL